MDGVQDSLKIVSTTTGITNGEEMPNEDLDDARESRR